MYKQMGGTRPHGLFAKRCIFIRIIYIYYLVQHIEVVKVMVDAMQYSIWWKWIFYAYVHTAHGLTSFYLKNEAKVVDQRSES